MCVECVEGCVTAGWSGWGPVVHGCVCVCVCECVWHRACVCVCASEGRCSLGRGHGCLDVVVSGA